MPTRVSLLGIVILLASACQARIPRYRFEPKLQQVLVQSDPDAREDVARLVMSVLRVQRVDRNRFELVARLRVENFVDRAIDIRTRDMTLVSGDLRAFGTPRVFPEADPTIAPRTSTSPSVATLDLVFPFPPDASAADMDLTALNVRWILLDGELEIPVDMSFVGKRVPTYVYYPAPYSWHDCGYGVWIGYR